MASEIRTLDFLIETPIRLEPDDNDGEATAWFLPGADTAHWLTSIINFFETSINSRLVPIPESRSEVRPVGALLVDAKLRPDAILDPNIVGYSRLFESAHNTLWIPSHSKLTPLMPRTSQSTGNSNKTKQSREAIDTLQLENKLPNNSVCVWHPQVGLIAAEHKELWRISDLVVLPQRLETDWHSPPNSPPFRSTIHQLVAPRITLEEIFKGASEEIASDDDLSQLGALPEEPTSSFGRASAKARRVMAKLLMGMTKKMPPGLAQSGWLKSIESWASSQLVQTAMSIMHARDREIERLMRLLETNPDEGLRFALPLGGIHRGLADAVSSLAARNVNFNLGTLLRGGGPASPWNMDYSTWQKLTLRYRELAKREMDMGRYRRAAYIYAHLLQDIRSAAGALEKGRIWREAAVLYSERLKTPEDAARCLLHIDEVEQAIELMRPLGKLVVLGDMCQTIGQSEAAVKCYNEAVKLALSKQQLVEAATILRQKLAQSSAAIELLLSTWPDFHDAVAAAELCFDWLGKDGEHNLASEFLETVANADSTSSSRTRSIVVLHNVATTYPDEDLASLAADKTRTTVARLLSDSPDADASRLLQLVASLRPSDQILRRDAQRVGIQLRESPRVLTRVIRDSDLVLTSKHEYSLPKIGSYCNAVMIGDEIFAACVRTNKLHVIRTHQLGLYAPQECTWHLEGESIRSFVTMQIHNTITGSRRLQLKVPHHRPLLNQQFPEFELMPRMVAIGTPHTQEEMPLNAFDFCRSEDRHIYIGYEDPSLRTFTLRTLRHLSPTLMSEIQFDLSEVDSDESDVVQQRARLGVWQKWVVFMSLQEIILFELDSLDYQLVICDRQVFPNRLRSFSGSFVGSVPRIAIGFKHGVGCHWVGSHISFSKVELPDFDPRVAFLPDGHVIATGDESLTLLSARDGVLRMRAQQKHSNGQPIAVLLGATSGEFFVVYASGEVRQFQIGMK